MPRSRPAPGVAHHVVPVTSGGRKPDVGQRDKPGVATLGIDPSICSVPPSAPFPRQQAAPSARRLICAGAGVTVGKRPAACSSAQAMHPVRA